MEFVSDSDSISSARLKLPNIISFVRKNIPPLKDTIVTHTGFELFPSDVKQHLEEKHLRHPDIGNLFSSGIWAIPDGKERKKKDSIAGRIETEEESVLELKNILTNTVDIFQKHLNLRVHLSGIVTGQM